MLSSCPQKVSFGYKVFVDSGASDSRRGTFKVSVRSEKTGEELLSTSSLPDEFKKVGPSTGFTSSDDYVNGLSRCISKAIELASDKIKDLIGKDKNLSGILIHAPGYVVGGKIAPLLNNLRDHNDKSLKNIDFSKVSVNVPKNDNYRIIATNDMHGAAAGVAKILKDQGKLDDGQFVVVCMTGGGLGLVSIKNKLDMIEIEGTEAGHTSTYDSISPNSLEKAGACVSALIKNYGRALSLGDDTIHKLLVNADARVVTNSLNSENADEVQAALTAIDRYVDVISHEFARNVLDGANLIILTGPLAQGIKKSLAEYTGNPEELKDRVMASIKKHIIKSGPGEIMMDIHKFDVDTDFHVPDNTVGGSILMDSSKFAGENSRGNWLMIPKDKL